MANVEFTEAQKQAAANSMAQMIAQSIHMLAVMIYTDLGVGPGDQTDADPMITVALGGVVAWAAKMGVTEPQAREAFERFLRSNLTPMMGALGADSIGKPEGHA